MSAASINVPLHVVSVVGDEVDVTAFDDALPQAVLGEVVVIATGPQLRLTISPWRFNLGPVPTVGDTITVNVATTWKQDENV